MSKSKTLFILHTILSIALADSSRTNAQSIAGGSVHSLFLCRDSTVMAVGNGGFGQLGNESPFTQTSTPLQVVSLTGITAVSCGGAHSLFVKNDGTVWTVGNNYYGQLGDGTTTDKSTPVQVSSLTGIVSAVSGTNHTLFVKNDSTVWAVGSNNYGQLGDGTQIDKSTPVQVSSLTGIIAVAAGQDHSLFLKNDSTVWAVGYNHRGQLGDGTTFDRSIPVQVSSLTGITSVAAGGSAWHSLFLKSDGTAWAVGINDIGQLGDGTTVDKHTAVQVNSLTGIVSLACGSNHSLFVKNNGTVWVTGLNIFGQLGDGTTINKSTPVQVNSLSGITSVAGGAFFSIFLKNDSTVWAVGRNTDGQLGDTSTIDKSNPVQVLNLCTVSPTIASSIKENLIENNFSIFPNPFSNQIVLQTDLLLNDATLTVYNALGEAVKQIKNISGHAFNLYRDNITNGLYYIRLTQDSKIYTNKLVVTD